VKHEYFESGYPDTARFEDIEELTRFIKSGASSQLISIPGGGRATILKLLAHNKNIRIKHFGASHSNYHFALIGFDEVRGRSLLDVTKFIFLTLIDSLKGRGFDKYHEHVNKVFREGLKFNDELVLFQKLKEAIDYLTISEKLKLILLFDHFEEYVPTVGKQFFANLRTLRNRAKYNFTVIISLTRPLEDVLDPDMISDFYEFISGNYVYLRLFDKVSTNFRITYIEKIVDKKLPEDILEEIIKQTGGVGKLLKLATEATLASNNLTIKQSNIILFSQKTIREALSEICRSLNPSEQSALIQEKYENTEVVDYLENIGILKNHKIQIPLFEEHIKSHRVEADKKRQKIIYFKTDNSIKKGETILSDQLTKSEFKLLSYFLKNSDKIVSRDDIIGATWSDLKSTEGITDQAVDQLIFRLRRKIEENPNKPHHLLTIKGRGFKFTV
jgi:DNA-binding winged helix-turn-helix (wHTH) protein